MMALTRREWLRGVAATGPALAALGCESGGGTSASPKSASKSTPAGPKYVDPKFEGKLPALKIVNDRPPCLETPWSYFQHDLTPNDAFYVRWHLPIPLQVDLKTWRLRIDGAVEKPLELSMEDLRKLPTQEIVAVNQCSGNSRSLFGPRVAGAQWGNGAMGNARWGGVSLARLLKLAGLRADAAQVAFDGLDTGSLPTVPDYVKALDIEQALRPEVLVAHSMNGEEMPALNGFPARLVVPGWYATYWVKSLQTITVLPKTFDGFWMAKAYRVPKTPDGRESPKALAPETVPISTMNIRSFFTSLDGKASATVGKALSIEGIAFDGGSGVKQVAVSDDGGKSWKDAELGKDLGIYSFRRWTLAWTPKETGTTKLLVRATSNDGQTQPMEAGWNRSGYMRNVIEEAIVDVS
jgi:DMSO/TMAO reductase YedYZ molybdopterin-dependent catalytic subunit